jgi:hypothetical protein
MKKEGKITPLKAHNSSITESKDNGMAEMPDKELKKICFQK